MQHLRIRGHYVLISVIFLAALTFIGGASALLLGGFGNSNTTIDLTSGLVGWWKLNGNTNDSSTYGNSGTAIDVTYTSDHNAQANSAGSFNGTTSYVKIPYSSAFHPSSSLTLSAWISPLSNNPSTSSVQKVISSTENGAWALEMTGTAADTSCAAKTMCFLLVLNGTYYAVSEPLSNLRANTWQLITGTFDGNVMNLYQNGTLIASRTQSGTITSVPNTVPLCIGAEAAVSSCANGLFSGSISDARIYNRTLNSSEAQQLYYVGQPVNLQSGLLGWWKLNGNTKDSSPYRNNGTATAITYTSDHKGVANSAASYNGTSSTIAGNFVSPYMSTTWTTSAWINTASFSTGQSYVVVGSSNRYLMITVSTNNNHIGCRVGTGTSNNLALANYAVTTNTWYLVTCTYDGSALNAYINGTLNSSLNAANAMDAGQTSFKIGGANYVNGAISDARIYNRVLNQSEITALYQQYNPSTNLDSGQAGLIGWWKLDGNTKDSSPYRHTGAASNITYATDRKGATNSAASFNGTSSRIALNVPQATNLNNYSFGTWFNPNTACVTSNPCGLISDVNNPRITWGVTGGNTQAVQFWANRPDNGSAGCTIASPTLALNTWHLVMIAITGASGSATTAKLYIDGKQTGATCSITGGFYGLQPSLYLDNRDSTTNFNGSMDDARVYNRALSASEVSILYNSYNPTLNVGAYSKNINLSSGLVGYWPFNGNANDATPYRDNATTAGTATLVADRKGRANSAYAFSGINNYKRLPVGAAVSKTSVTASAWVKVDTPELYDTVIANGWGSGTPANGGWTLNYDDTYVTFAMRDNNNAQFSASCTPTTPMANTWHLLTGTYDGTTARLYLDGVLCASNAPHVGVNLNVPSSFIVGQTSSTGNTNTHTIDDVRIYNRALSAAEVVALYNEYN